MRETAGAIPSFRFIVYTSRRLQIVAGMSSATEISRSVAIVGRPNVGKSRLFNRLVGRRVSIVHDMPGVTRDLITERVADGNYLLMDTGGIGLTSKLTPKVIADAIEEQVDFAVNAAQVVLLVADITAGCTPLDLEIAAKLRHFGKRVILVANKADNETRAANQSDFFGLGFGPAAIVSAEHGIGFDYLIGQIKSALGPEPEISEEDEAARRQRLAQKRIRLCLAGRPNVGKSSLGNRLLKSDRLIVSEIAGTTRDPVRTHLDYTAEDGEKWPFELVDTAGRRAQTRHDVLDYFSELRTDELLFSADVVFLVLDATEGITRIDKQLSGKIMENGPGLIIVVNKWDLAREKFITGEGDVGGCTTEPEFRKKYLRAVRDSLFFLPESPVLFTSALDNFKVEELLANAREVYQRMNGKIPTAQLNKALHTLMDRQPPRLVSGRRFKCYYALQTGNNPFTVRLYCNTKEKLETAYERYLIAGLHDAFSLEGVPVKLEAVGKQKDPERDFFQQQQSKTVGAKASNKPTSKKKSPAPRKPTARTGKKTGGKSPAKKGPKSLRGLKQRKPQGRDRRR